MPVPLSNATAAIAQKVGAAPKVWTCVDNEEKGGNRCGLTGANKDKPCMSERNGLCSAKGDNKCSNNTLDCSAAAHPVKNGDILVLCSSANPGWALGLRPSEYGNGYTGLRVYDGTDAFYFTVNTQNYTFVENMATLKLQNRRQISDEGSSKSWSWCWHGYWAVDGGPDDGAVQFYGRGGFKKSEVLTYGTVVDVKIKESGGDYRIAYQKDQWVECDEHGSGHGYYEMHLVLSNPEKGCPK